MNTDAEACRAWNEDVDAHNLECARWCEMPPLDPERKDLSQRNHARAEVLAERWWNLPMRFRVN